MEPLTTGKRQSRSLQALLLILIVLVVGAFLWYMFLKCRLQPSTKYQQSPIEATPGSTVWVTETAVNWGGYDLHDQNQIVNLTTSFSFDKLFRDYHVTSKVEAAAAFTHASGIISKTVYDYFETYLLDGRPFALSDSIVLDLYVNARLGVPPRHTFTAWPQRAWIHPSSNESYINLYILPATPPGTYHIQFGSKEVDSGLFVIDGNFVVKQAVLSIPIRVGAAQ